MTLVSFTTHAIFRYIRRIQREIMRTQRSRSSWAGVAGIVIGIIIIQQFMPTTINHASYLPLLTVIATGESGGNYNAHFGNPANIQIRFTDMTLAEVRQWQTNYLQQGKPSNAVGRYQFMGTTLDGLIKQLNIDRNARFDEAMQDRLAIALIERRGANAYVDQQISREQFAANLAQEWAALPRVIGDNPEESYYAGDGLNQSKIKISEILPAIDALQKE